METESREAIVEGWEEQRGGDGLGVWDAEMQLLHAEWVNKALLAARGALFSIHCPVIVNLLVTSTV